MPIEMPIPHVAPTPISKEELIEKCPNFFDNLIMLKEILPRLKPLVEAARKLSAANAELSSTPSAKKNPQLAEGMLRHSVAVGEAVLRMEEVTKTVSSISFEGGTKIVEQMKKNISGDGPSQR